MITFAVDDSAYMLLKQWAFYYSDYVIRFCDDMTPKFRKARIILEHDSKDPVDIIYDINEDKKATLLLPSTGKEQIRFFIDNDPKNELHYRITSRFEKTAVFYVDISNVFLYINAFLLYGEYSPSAKKAFEKKTLQEFRTRTEFTFRDKNSRVILDTCTIERNGDSFTVQ